MMQLKLCTVPALGIMTLFAIAADNPATHPTSTPADAEVDWLLSHASTAPAIAASQPTTRPAVPFSAKDKDNADSYRPAIIVFSVGERLIVRLATTPNKPVRLWDQQKQEYRDIPFAMIKSFQAHVIWERDEKEWHFPQSGSDVKEYTGKTYPARETQYTITLINGQTITGGLVLPLYVQAHTGDRVLVLHKRDKGTVGQSLKDLVYIQRIDFQD